MWNFSKLFTNSEIHDNLKKTVHEGRVSHAQIFYGHEGSEVLPTAFAFVKFIFCNNRNEADACGRCQNCKLIDGLNHPDFKIFFPFPYVKGKIEKSSDLINDFVKHFQNNPYLDIFLFSQKILADKKSFSIPTSEAESINKFLGLKSFLGGKKVVLVWYPESLNVAGANKILKTIEEPTGDSLILFVSHNIYDVLPTILSRCQVTFFKRPDIVQIKKFIEAKTNQDNYSNAELLAAISNSNLGTITEILDDLNPFSQFDIIFSDFMNFIFNKKDHQLIWSIQNHIDFLSNKGREFTKHFLIYFLNQIHRKYIQKIHEETELGYILILREIIDYHIILIERNVSIKMVLFSLLISGKNANSNPDMYNLIRETVSI